MHVRILKTFEELGVTYQPSAKGEHVATSVAEHWFQAKVAAPFKYASAAERLADEEAERQKNFPPVSTAPVWTVRRLPSSQKIVVGYKHLTEERLYGPTVLFGGKNDDKNFVKILQAAKCPQSVIDAYLKAANAPDQLAIDANRIDGEKRAQAEREEADKHRIHYI